MLREFFRNDDFCTDARVLRRQQAASVPTAVPDTEAQASLLAWADALFNSISTLVVDFNPYPMHVTTARGEHLCLVVIVRGVVRCDGDLHIFLLIVVIYLIQQRVDLTSTNESSPHPLLPRPFVSDKLSCCIWSESTAGKIRTWTPGRSWLAIVRAIR